MAINNISFAGYSLDLTGDTVTPESLKAGFTAHDKTGAAITGTLKVVTVRTGNGIPAASLGADNDIYLKI